jgi:hypothetical protein
MPEYQVTMQEARCQILDNNPIGRSKECEHVLDEVTVGICTWACIYVDNVSAYPNANELVGVKSKTRYWAGVGRYAKHAK